MVRMIDNQRRTSVARDSCRVHFSETLHEGVGDGSSFYGGDGRVRDGSERRRGRRSVTACPPLWTWFASPVTTGTERAQPSVTPRFPTGRHSCSSRRVRLSRTRSPRARSRASSRRRCYSHVPTCCRRNCAGSHARSCRGDCGRRAGGDLRQRLRTNRDRRAGRDRLSSWTGANRYDTAAQARRLLE